MTDWVAWIGAVSGPLGVAVAVPALWVSRRSAKASEDSVAEARHISRLEQDRRHENLSPLRSLKVEFEAEPNELMGDGHRSLMAVIELPRSEAPRTYRIQGIARAGNSSWKLGFPLLHLHPDQPAKVEVEKWPPDRNEPRAEDLLLRFWPPVEGDQVEHWTCQCGRPVTEGTGHEPTSHWEMPIPVDYQDKSMRVRFLE